MSESPRRFLFPRDQLRILLKASPPERVVGHILDADEPFDGWGPFPDSWLTAQRLIEIVGRQREPQLQIDEKEDACYYLLLAEPVMVEPWSELFAVLSGAHLQSLESRRSASSAADEERERLRQRIDGALRGEPTIADRLHRNVVSGRFAPLLASCPDRDLLEKALDRLAATFKDPSDEIRKDAVSALGRTGSSRAVPALIRFLRDANVWVRQTAARELGTIGDPSAIEPLLETLQASRNADAVLFATDGGAPPSFYVALPELQIRETILASLRALGHPIESLREATNVYPGAVVLAWYVEASGCPSRALIESLAAATFQREGAKASDELAEWIMRSLRKESALVALLPIVIQHPVAITPKLERALAAPEAQSAFRELARAPRRMVSPMPPQVAARLGLAKFFPRQRSKT